MNKNIFLREIVLMVLVMLLISGCDKKKTCPGFPPEHLSPINYSVNDKLTFRDSTGNEIVFSVSQVHVDGKTKAKAKYYLQIICGADANFKSISDSSRNGNNKLEISLEIADATHDSSEVTAEYSVLGMYGKHIVSPSIKIENGSKDTLIYNLTLGNISYADVIVSKIDTVLYPQYIVWKIYYSKNSGIIGFEDRQTHSLYYRE